MENIENSGKSLEQQEVGLEENLEETSQFLKFEVGDSGYAIDIMKVMEIRGWTGTTRIPNSPEYMRGVINLRGLVIPVFDLRTRFGQGKTDANEKHVVIVISVGDRTIGILVDEVSDILTIKDNEIKTSPSSGESEIQDEYVSGLISYDEKMVILLNIEYLFNSENLEDLEEVANS